MLVSALRREQVGMRVYVRVYVRVCVCACRCLSVRALLSVRVRVIEVN